MAALPEQKTQPLERLEDYMILIYGQPKIGKSTFCAAMPDPLFIATEKGLNALSAYVADVKTWNEFLEIGKELEASDRFGTIVIDTVDLLYQFCIDHVCAVQKIRHPSDLEYGKGWYLTQREFQRPIVKLSHMNRGLVLVSHAQDITLKTRTSEITKAVPTLTGKAREMVLNMADIILYAEVQDTPKGQQRLLHAAPSESYEAGDRTGRLPDVMPLDWSAVVDAFNKGGK